jgi:very-short-patch-repair endonuclease
MKSLLYYPYEKNVIHNAKKLRNNQTDEENRLWYQFLRCYFVRFIRQKVIDRFILDFYCAKYKLGIEVDGSQHMTAQGIGYDEARTKVLNAFGVTIMRFTNEQIRNEFQTVCVSIDLKIKELSGQPV